MNSQNISKINNLLKNWPKGTVAAYDWLEGQGVYRQLADGYVKSGWLERVGRGAFKRAGDQVDWMGSLYAMQSGAKLFVHVGGKTALSMLGSAHFLPMGPEAVVLFGAPGVKLPAWFVRQEWKERVSFTSTGLFGDRPELGLTDFNIGEYALKISAAERAMFEVCYGVPEVETFEEARQLMEGLTTLRPGLVQTLLEACHSVKAKRLFMYFAEDCAHAWVKRLDLSKVDFGKGNRSLCKEGKGQYSKKYQLVVPRKDAAA